MCKARGVFRDKGIRPLSGDIVDFRISREDGNGYIERVHDRKNQLKRPPVANVDQALILISIKEPDINLNLLDRYLVQVESEGLKAIICFNKIDLVEDSSLLKVKDIYEKIGYEAILTSSETYQGHEEVMDLLEGKLTAIFGPSGSGKSTLINSLDPSYNLETGGISEKTKRGRHTTRHVELFEIQGNGYIFDTPGFSSLSMDFVERVEDLSDYFPEFRLRKKECKFDDCIHENEPKCAVKEAVKEGQIERSRYDNYLLMLEEVRLNWRNKYD